MPKTPDPSLLLFHLDYYADLAEQRGSDSFDAGVAHGLRLAATALGIEVEK